MTRLVCRTTLIVLLISSQAYTQTIDSLRHHIKKIAASTNAVVGVSIVGNNGVDTIAVNAKRHFPMQSVFKFHIAVTMLSEIDKGNFSLNQKIKIQKKDLVPEIYSPIRENILKGQHLLLQRF